MANKLTSAEWISAQKLIALAIVEDLGRSHDITTRSIIPKAAMGSARLVARTSGVIAGLEIVVMVCQALRDDLKFTPLVQDGDQVAHGQSLGTITGGMWSMLAAERTALNFLQHLSGVATLTRQYVDAVAGQSKIYDTRKTLPGWRLLEKYAVRCGGGHNHRMGLFDAILIKDNHLAALGGGPPALAKAVAAARSNHPNVPLEVEVDSWDLFLAALDAKPDVIMLDNMTVELMRQCVERRNAQVTKIELEASGGINLMTVARIAATGVDRISIGALTHSAPALDIALDYI